MAGSIFTCKYHLSNSEGEYQYPEIVSLPKLKLIMVFCTFYTSFCKTPVNLNKMFSSVEDIADVQLLRQQGVETQESPAHLFILWSFTWRL